LRRLPRLLGRLEAAADRLAEPEPPSSFAAPLGTPWWAWAVLTLAVGIALLR
jgi:hypothetical protein